MPLHGRHRHSRRHLNRRIGLLFAVGSTLFVLGGVLGLAPQLAQRWSLAPADINGIFFAGSIPFTAAAYLQLLQSANPLATAARGIPAPGATNWFGWRPGDINWLGCALQFLGTLLFNVNTFDGLLPGLDRLRQDLALWAPDMIGSALFLASGYLAAVEYWQSAGAWRPGQRNWWIVVVNLLGCIAFMVAAVLAFTPAVADGAGWLAASTTFLVIGALAFLLGALLLVPDGAGQIPGE